MSDAPVRTRVGLLGGAFNPPHAGHLRLAELALHHLGLQEVRFIPTARSPHKVSAGPAGEVRLALLQAALQDTGLPFRTDPVELVRGGVSYTVDTLEALAEAEPGCAWIWLVGSDQLSGLLGWRNLDRILGLASLAVSLRPGHPGQLPEPLQPRLREAWSGLPGEIVSLPGTELDLASRVIRADLASRRPAEGLSLQVRDAIQRGNLYRNGSEESE